MAQTKLQAKMDGAIKRMSVQKPWDLLDKTIPFDANTYSYPIRKGTMPPVVRLYGTFVEAATMHDATNPYPLVPFRLSEKRNGNHTKTFLEALMPDGTSFVVLCEYQGGQNYKLRASVVETDGTRSPTVAFKDMDMSALSCICLALWPDIMVIDSTKGNGRIIEATRELGKAADDRVAAPWNDKFAVPDVAKEAAYTLDAVLSIFKEEMIIDCGDNNSDTPAEIEDSYFRNGVIEDAKLICENFGAASWTPMVVSANGKAKKRGKAGTISIGAAKDEFSVYSAGRNWTSQEKALIPSFPDDMPVMPEVVRMAKRIVSSRNDLNPVCNLMWRGETGFGKSTGMKQLACILNMPFLTQTCHPAMEAQDLKSMFVPASSPEDSLDGFDYSCMETNATTTAASGTPEATYEYAISYIVGMDPDKRKELMENDAQFFETALMDQEEAETTLFGCVVGCELPDLLSIYTKVRTELMRKFFEVEMAKMQEQVQPPVPNAKEGPEFIHVVSPYIKAMTKGYIVEIQEASRIRDSGVMVSINEFDRPGAMLPMMNGSMAIRHKDAICVITDNVGYSSCRPIDPSVIRRQSMIIDSYDLPKEILIDRVKRNTGVTDSNLLTIAYNLWNAVREYCQQNSITEGSTSPVELERFVQAVKYDGTESIAVNLDDCIISKATSSIEDQREIRSVCSVLIPTV